MEPGTTGNGGRNNIFLLEISDSRFGPVEMAHGGGVHLWGECANVTDVQAGSFYIFNERILSKNVYFLLCLESAIRPEKSLYTEFVSSSNSKAQFESG